MIVAPLARWSSRIALFSACVLLVDAGAASAHLVPDPGCHQSVCGRRCRSRPGGAGRARRPAPDLAQGLRRRRQRGVRRAAALLLLAWPLTYVPAYLNLPPDQRCVDRFRDAAAVRGAGQAARRGNRLGGLSGARFAAAQQKAYPDLRTFVVDRPVGGGVRARRGGGAETQVAGGGLRAAGDRARGQAPASSRPPTRRWSSASPTTSSSAWRAASTARASTYAPPRATASTISARTPRACAASSPSCRPASRRPPPASPAAAACARRGPARWLKRRKDAIRRKRRLATDETALNQVLNVREHRKRRRVEELGVEAAVDHRHDGRAPCRCRRGCTRGSPARACAGAAGRP